MTSRDAPRRPARIEALFRELNSRLAELYLHLDDTADGVFHCECSDTECATELELTMEQYARIRAHPRQFAVVPGHERVSVERVVETAVGYTVVEKVAS
jgi:hypothetical protein